VKGRHRQQTWLDTSTRGQGLSRQHEWYWLCKMMTSTTFLYEHRLKKISGNMYGTWRHAIFHWKLQVHVFSVIPCHAMCLIPHLWEPTGTIRDHLLISVIDRPIAHIISNKLWTCLSRKGHFNFTSRSKSQGIMSGQWEECSRVSYCHYAKSSLTGLATLQHTFTATRGAAPIKCTCIILSDTDAYKKISALPWIHSSSLWDLKAEYDSMDMISNHQHHSDSAVSLVNFIRPGEPGLHHLFHHCFGCLSTSIWQFGTLIHCHMLPACHTNSPLHYHDVPPLFGPRVLLQVTMLWDANCEGWLTCSPQP